MAELYKRLGQAEPEFGGGLTLRLGRAGFGEPRARTRRLIELIQAGRKIEAIKLYRELTGVGLAEAKDAVERLEETYRPIG